MPTTVAKSTGADFDAMMRSIAAETPGANSGSTKVAVSGSTMANLENLERISTSISHALTANKVAVQSIAEADAANTKRLQDMATAGAEVQAAAGEAAGTLAAQKTSGEYQTQQANIATQEAAGLLPNDPNSLLRDSIKSFINNTDIATANIVAAGKARNTTLGGVLRGEDSFKDWAHTKFVKGEEDYLADANTAKSIATIEAGKITGLQGIYTNQTAINTTAVNALTAGSASDAATKAASTYMLAATELQKQSIVAGSELLARKMSTVQHALGNTIAAGQLENNIEQNRKAFMAFAAQHEGASKEYMALVNTGLRSMGKPEFTDVATLETFRKNPVNKALLDKAAFAGSSFYGMAMRPEMGVTNAYGSPGETQEFFAAFNGKMPQGMENLQDKLDGFASRIPPGTKPADKPAMIDSAFKQYRDNIIDVDTDPIFGKPNTRDIASWASMNTPEMAAFTAQVIKPLAASGEYIPMNMIVETALTSGLPPQTINHGLGVYATTAKEYVEATRRNGLAGAVAPKHYKVQVPKTIGAFGKATVDFTDEKARTTYLFYRLKGRGPTIREAYFEEPPKLGN